MKQQKGSSMDYKDLGARVRRQRQLLEWTQDRLAREIGVSTSFIGHVERGSRKASLETLVAIANALNVSTDYLLAGSLEGSLPPEQPYPPLNSGRRAKLNELVNDMQYYLQHWDEEKGAKP